MQLQFDFELVQTANGSRKFVLLSQLEEGHFMDTGGEFQLELSLSAVRSIYEHRDTHSLDIWRRSSS